MTVSEANLRTIANCPRPLIRQIRDCLDQRSLVWFGTAHKSFQCVLTTEWLAHDVMTNRLFLVRCINLATTDSWPKTLTRLVEYRNYSGARKQKILSLVLDPKNLQFLRDLQDKVTAERVNTTQLARELRLAQSITQVHSDKILTKSVDTVVPTLATYFDIHAATMATIRNILQSPESEEDQKISFDLTDPSNTENSTKPTRKVTEIDLINSKRKWSNRNLIYCQSVYSYLSVKDLRQLDQTSSLFRYSLVASSKFADLLMISCITGFLEPEIHKFSPAKILKAQSVMFQQCFESQTPLSLRDRTYNCVARSVSQHTACLLYEMDEQSHDMNAVSRQVVKQYELASHLINRCEKEVPEDKGCIIS